MIFVNQNLSFVQRARMDPSWTGQAKYQIGGRISTLGTSLCLLAESVTKAAFACISAFLSLFCVKLEFAFDQMREAYSRFSVGIDCFLSVFSPKGLSLDLEDRLVNGPFRSMVRENRVRVGSSLIQTKLKSEFFNAQRQMRQQEDGKFQYLQGKVDSLKGSVEKERIGGYEVGICHCQGRRESMEDEHLAIAFDLDIHGKKYPVQLFGIFDGHGGVEAARYLKEHVTDAIEKTLVKFNPDKLTDEGIWNALKMAFVQLNRDFEGKSGSTATVAMILDHNLWTANVGDSRTILEDHGQILQLSEDAKPSDARYEQGIRHRGGFVDRFYKRVNRVLAVARSIGDHWSNGAVSARPKITKILMPKSFKAAYNPPILVLACDGIYDVASTKQVGSAVREYADEPCTALAENIVYSAYQAGSEDNLSTMVIKLA